MIASQGKFAAAPTVLVTAEHISAAFKHDAASLWVENATSSSFYICLRELQNYDGLHEDIFVVILHLYFSKRNTLWTLKKKVQKARPKWKLCKREDMQKDIQSTGDDMKAPTLARLTAIKEYLLFRAFDDFSHALIVVIPLTL